MSLKVVGIIALAVVVSFANGQRTNQMVDACIQANCTAPQCLSKIPSQYQAAVTACLNTFDAAVQQALSTSNCTANLMLPCKSEARGRGGEGENRGNEHSGSRRGEGRRHSRQSSFGGGRHGNQHISNGFGEFGVFREVETCLRSCSEGCHQGCAPSHHHHFGQQTGSSTVSPAPQGPCSEWPLIKAAGQAFKQCLGAAIGSTASSTTTTQASG